VLVVDVLPMAIVIEGVHLVTFAGETQYVVLHGLVRPDDIGSNNTILSTNIADARIEFYNQGSLTDMQIAAGSANCTRNCARSEQRLKD